MRMATAAHVGIVRQSVGWSIVLSVVMILAGILAITVPVVGGISVAILVAWLLTFSGVAHLVFAWHLRTTGSFFWQLLIGILYLAIAFYILTRPAAGLMAIILGGMIGSTWPSSSEWAIGTLIGVSILFAGISRLSISMAARRIIPKAL